MNAAPTFFQQRVEGVVTLMTRACTGASVTQALEAVVDGALSILAADNASLSRVEPELGLVRTLTTREDSLLASVAVLSRRPTC